MTDKTGGTDGTAQTERGTGADRAAGAPSAASAPPVKCLVWDLDGTLWQGTLLEGDEPELRPGVRELIAELDRRGILHAVASRNDHDQAWPHLERLGVAEYFVSARIGWGRKPESVRGIAERLGFATAALAFVDDTEYERAEMAAHLPEVRVYTPEDLASLAERPEFTPGTVTAEAAGRRRMYQAGMARDRAREEFDGPDEAFLRSLEIEMSIGRATEGDLVRLAELTLRTSQMNATGVHYPHDALVRLIAEPGHEVLAVTMRDRFGSHGAVGVVLLRTDTPQWHLKLLATSCRVVSFGAGSLILRNLLDQAARAGTGIVADFRPTDRNRVMEITYRFAGFEDAPAGATRGLPPAEDGVQRLHALPERQPPERAVTVRAVDLGHVGGEAA
ncbi:HAD-IIIC family phosphatase [Streptomyces sp. CBMA370]|uniref:HAD-IIIC family phosphatase n=1 Tax=unclassified Streptomyces TaxID=2593676 RepID=UPI002948B9F9|nr:HAD-IIIC family phosphatase [Streptomyces sp. CBMA370]